MISGVNQSVFACILLSYLLYIDSVPMKSSTPVIKKGDSTPNPRKIRGYCGWYSNANQAHNLAVNVSKHLDEEYPPGSGLFEPYIIHDVPYYAALSPVVDSARSQGVPISVMVFSLPTLFSGPGNATDGHSRSWFVLDPSQPTFKMDRFIARSVELAVQNGWTGYNLDDEVAGAPRVDRRDFELWLDFVNRWGNALHAAGLTLTADIQAMSWVNISQPELSKMLIESSVDRWVTMDTYWGGLAFFYDNFEYYQSLLPPSRLGIGLYPDGCTLGQCERPPLGMDDATARGWALGAGGAEEAWIWVLPVSNKDFIGPLMRWKRACAGCAAGSCWESGTCLAAAAPVPPAPAPPPSQRVTPVNLEAVQALSSQKSRRMHAH